MLATRRDLEERFPKLVISGADAEDALRVCKDMGGRGGAILPPGTRVEILPPNSRALDLRVTENHVRRMWRGKARRRALRAFEASRAAERARWRWVEPGPFSMPGTFILTSFADGSVFMSGGPLVGEGGLITGVIA